MREPDQTLTEDRYAFAGSNVVKAIISAQRGADNKSFTVFDIGAGQCPMQDLIEGAGAQWFGFDLFPVNDHVQRWNLEDPCPIQEKADFIILLDVLEHLFNPGLGLQNIRNAMADGGKLLLTMPNPRWSRSRLHFLRSGFLPAFDERDLLVNHHVFTPWPHVLEHLLESSGFAIEQYVTLDKNEARDRKGQGLADFALNSVINVISDIIEKTDESSKGFSFGYLVRKVETTQRLYAGKIVEPEMISSDN